MGIEWTPPISRMACRSHEISKLVVIIYTHFDIYLPRNLPTKYVQAPTNLNAARPATDHNTTDK